MDKILSRRTLLASGVPAAGMLSRGRIPESYAETKPESTKESAFRYCLNTGTIRGQKLSLAQEIETAAQAGYDAIEPWLSSIHQYAQGGNSLKDLCKRIKDLGITVESAIGFSTWIAEDDSVSAKGMEEAKKDLEVLAQIGCKRIAAPPAGATDKPGLDLRKAAERYRKLLELGEQFGIVPQVEVWGFSKNLSRLCEVAYVMLESGHAQACLLADVFQLYKGGSDFGGLKLLSSQALQVFHLNDYPAEPPRESVNDSHRVYPGDGIAPMNQILRDLYATGNGKILSLEIFNREYWKQDAKQTAADGLAKMKAAVKKALGS